MAEQKKRKKRAKALLYLHIMASAWRRCALVIYLLAVFIGCLYVYSKTSVFSKTADPGLPKDQVVQTTSLAILETTEKNAFAEEKKKILQSFVIRGHIKNRKIIGIDLGSTYSRVGVFKNLEVELITNEQGQSTTPSWVAFTDREILIGEAAKNQAPENAERTIFNFKRFIGRKFEDKEVQADMKRVPYKFVNKHGKPYIQVNVSDGVTKAFSPEEITTMVLTKMKETAEIYLGEKIKDAVLTVPAYFDDTQRQSMKEAGIMAGLNVVGVINEPIAAAISYNLNIDCGRRNVLVFDLGGGTFDVTILHIVLSKFDVLAISGDTQLGGDYFDERVMDYFIQLIQKQHEKDIRKDERALWKLRRECERAKIVLSSQNETHLVIESLFDGVNFSVPFTRAHFEQLNDDLFIKTLEPVKKAMEDAGFEKHQIDKIILAGGSTQIPKVKQILKDFFNKDILTKRLNTDEAVSSGASALGGILNGDFYDYSSLDCLRFYEVTPVVVGIETVGGVMTELIPKDTIIPVKRSQIFTSYQDQQTTFTIQVFQGGDGRNLTKDCWPIAKFDLAGVTPVQRGNARIEVTAEVDENGELRVKAQDLASGKAAKITPRYSTHVVRPL